MSSGTLVRLLLRANIAINQSSAGVVTRSRPEALHSSEHKIFAVIQIPESLDYTERHIEPPSRIGRTTPFLSHPADRHLNESVKRLLLEHLHNFFGVDCIKLLIGNIFKNRVKKGFVKFLLYSANI